MLKPEQTLAIFMEENLGESEGKMGYGVMRYSPNSVTCVIDSRHAGKQVNDVVDMPRNCPVVANVEEARKLGAEVLVLGIAPTGGLLPEPWLAELEKALSLGMSLANGLHDDLNAKFGHLLNDDQWIWDIRHPGETPPITSADAAQLNNKRVLLIGTDMAIGKMTAGLEVYRWVRDQGHSTAFLATGQIGITITGRGIPLDGIKIDHAVNAVSTLVSSASKEDIVFIEGQGSLLHPRSSATLALMRGACPTHLILCHRAGMEYLDQFPEFKVPPLKEFIKLNEDLASACGTFSKPKTIGIALKTAHLSDEDARAAITDLEDETGLPVDDVVRYGAEKIGQQLLSED
jgi:uncharacterized NAD-dependent epimerase/dehydratase family protein